MPADFTCATRGPCPNIHELNFQVTPPLTDRRSIYLRFAAYTSNATGLDLQLLSFVMPFFFSFADIVHTYIAVGKLNLIQFKR